MDLTLLLPELLLVASGIIILVADWFLPKGKKQIIGQLTFLLIVVAFLVTHFGAANHWFPDAGNLYLTSPNGEAYFQGFVVDSFSLFFKKLFLVVALFVVVLSLMFFREESENHGEYYALLVFITLGACLLVSSVDLLTLFLSFELMSIPLYILCGFLKKDAKSSEAGLKYFLMGAVTSAMLAYGISLIYAATGTTDLLHTLAPHAVTLERLGQNPILLVGILFALVAFLFKIASVPFHMWAPDVYEGAPAPVVAFLAIVPKFAVIGMLIRVFLVNMPQATPFWTWLFGILAALSMTVGNLMALHQQNLKRLLAYSGISQMGYILVGLASIESTSATQPLLQTGFQAVLFYLVAYAFTEIAAFGVITYLSSQGQDLINHCRGLGSRAPGLAFIFLLSLLSLAGIPPLVGFLGKFYLLTAAFSSKLYWLAALGILNSVVSLYYYLRVAKAMYFETDAHSLKLVEISFPMKTALWITCGAIVAFGLFPKMVISLTQNALSKLLIGL